MRRSSDESDKILIGRAIIGLTDEKLICFLESIRLYSTTGGQAVNKIITVARTAGGCIEHLAVDGIGLLHGGDPFGSAVCAFGRLAKVEDD